MPAAAVETKPRAARARKAPARPVKAEPATSIVLKHPTEERRRRIRVGFAWDLFLLSAFLGLPLFLRRLPLWGGIMVGLWLLDFFLGWVTHGFFATAAQVLLFAAFLAIQIWLGFRGNAMTAQAYLAAGWTAEDARDAGVRLVLGRWGIGG